MRRTLAMHHTPPPAAELNLNTFSVSYACEAQANEPLRDAAYRLASLAICHIDLVDSRWVCDLQITAEATRRNMRLEDVRGQFISAVNDENIRFRLWRDAEGLRNVIVALAFGSLAREVAAETSPAE